MDEVDTIVIGAGVVGLAIAAKLATNREVLVLEREPEIGQGISSRNSEVIHAGIYYPEGSLKARLCVRGKELLYEYCAERTLPHCQIGKLIVAGEENEADKLDEILTQATNNGVTDLERLSRSQLNNREPNVKGVEALFSPSTGIVSAHDLMFSLAGDVSNSGGQLATHSSVCSVEKVPFGFRVNCEIEGEPYSISCRRLINAGGLSAQSIAARCDFMPAALIPELHLCRGNYFSYAGKSPFTHLIYPVPEPNQVGLGVHATLDMGGQVKFGPDTEYVDCINYEMPEQVPEQYVAAISKYFPDLERDNLQPGYAGIRPKLSAAGESAADFCIQAKADHEIDGLVQLFGIESPGLTASLAIAEHVEKVL